MAEPPPAGRGDRRGGRGLDGGDASDRPHWGQKLALAASGNRQFEQKLAMESSIWDCARRGHEQLKLFREGFQAVLEFVVKAAFGAGGEQAKSVALGFGGFGSVTRAEIRPRQGIEKEGIGAVGGGDGVLGEVEGFGGLEEIGLVDFEKRVGVFVPFDGSGGRFLRGSLEEGEGVLGSLVGGGLVAGLLKASGECQQGYGEPER